MTSNGISVNLKRSVVMKTSQKFVSSLTQVETIHMIKSSKKSLFINDTQIGNIVKFT